jgi:ribosomal protein S27E
MPGKIHRTKAEHIVELDAAGMPKKDIATTVDVDPKTVRKVLKDAKSETAIRGTPAIQLTQHHIDAILAMIDERTSNAHLRPLTAEQSTAVKALLDERKQLGAELPLSGGEIKMARKLVAKAPDPDYWILESHEIDAIRDLLVQQEGSAGFYKRVPCPECPAIWTILTDAAVVQCASCLEVFTTGGK